MISAMEPLVIPSWTMFQLYMVASPLQDFPTMDILTQDIFLPFQSILQPGQDTMDLLFMMKATTMFMDTTQTMSGTLTSVATQTPLLPTTHMVEDL